MHCHHGDKRLQTIKHRHCQFWGLATQYHIFLKAHRSDLLLVVKIIFVSLQYHVITFVFTNLILQTIFNQYQKIILFSLMYTLKCHFRQHRILSLKHLHSLHLLLVTKLRLLQPGEFSQVGLQANA